MKRTTLLAGLVVLGLGAAAVWLSGGRGTTLQPEASETVAAAYDYQAEGVVVQQMGADGRLQYQLEARDVTQQPQNGEISANGLTLFHDPAGAAPGGTGRWTLTAERGALPTEGGLLRLQGNVRASGRTVEDGVPLRFATERLSYDLERQELTSGDAEVLATWGAGSTVRGRQLRANIKTGVVRLESQVNGTLVP